MAQDARYMMSSLTTQKIQKAIIQEDIRLIQSIKGIGPKSAQRLVLELKDKLKKIRVKEEVIQKGKKKPVTSIYKTKLVETPIYSLAEIDTIVQTKKTKAVKVSQNFKIHFLYFTAWYDHGIFNFRNDVYKYDTELYQRLSNQFTSNLITSTRMEDK